MKRRRLTLGILTIVLPLVVAGCLDTSIPTPDYNQILTDNLSHVPAPQLAADIEIIEDSLQLWGINDFDVEPHGVRYTIESLGTGSRPLLTSFIRAKYKARIMKNGRASTPFDQGDNLSIYLYNLIYGWQTTLPLLPQGTKATLYVPSGLAYGAQDVKNQQGDIIIPKNSNLIFEIELLEVVN